MVRERLTKVLNLRIAPSEHEMLARLSENTGLPMSMVLRQLLRREYAALHDEGPPQRSVAKRRRK